MRLFESGAIMLYLAEKHGRFIPRDTQTRAECINWLLWAQAQGTITGNYGHFFVYAPADQGAAREYGVFRYGMDVQRMCSVLDQHLATRRYLCGGEYTVADMACLPWFHLLRDRGYWHASGVKAKDFLSLAQYTHANRWADELVARPEVQRGMLVCRGQFAKPWLNPDDKRFTHLKGKVSPPGVGRAKL